MNIAPQLKCSFNTKVPNSAMSKLIWMSDLHFTAKGEVLDHDPRVRLAAAVDHINTHHADAAVCVISGDLVNHGTAKDYAALGAALDDLSVPFFPMVGNHDNRGLLRSALPVPQGGMDEFVQYAVSTPAGLILCLDTQKLGSDAGAFCPDRMEWLARTLGDARDQPVLLFMHHPPMPLGLPMQDTDRMEDGAAFLDLVARFDCVSYMCIGHVHRPISGVIQGIPYSTMRSVLYQAPPPVPDWTWETFQPAAEAPQIGVVTIHEGRVTLQYDTFCAYEVGVKPVQR